MTMRQEIVQLVSNRLLDRQILSLSRRYVADQISAYDLLKGLEELQQENPEEFTQATKHLFAKVA